MASWDHFPLCDRSTIYKIKVIGEAGSIRSPVIRSRHPGRGNFLAVRCGDGDILNQEDVHPPRHNRAPADPATRGQKLATQVLRRRPLAGQAHAERGLQNQCHHLAVAVTTPLGLAVARRKHNYDTGDLFRRSGRLAQNGGDLKLFKAPE